MELLRPLHDNVLAGAFVKGILNIQQPEEIKNAIRKIVNAELKLKAYEGKCTLRCSEYREYGYHTDEQRRVLRKKIFEELISMKRLDNDDNIKLGSGGSLPQTEIKAGRQAYIIIGLPASGKSGITNRISDTYGAVIIDSDYAKRKFPEFYQDFGATLVHQESSDVMFGKPIRGSDDNYFVLEYCLLKGYNVAIQKNWRRF